MTRRRGRRDYTESSVSESDFDNGIGIDDGSEVGDVEEDHSQSGSESPKNAKRKYEGSTKGREGRAPPSKERIQRLDQIYSKRRRQDYFVPTLQSKAKPELSGKTSHIVLKVRRIIGELGFPVRTEIDIRSELLAYALAEIYAGIEGLDFTEYPPQVSPDLLFHARDGIAARVKAEKAKEPSNKALLDELGVALQFIAEDYDPIMINLVSLSKHNEITFDLLWTLFPPNTSVYTQDNALKDHQVLRLRQGKYMTQGGGSCFSLDTRMISHDGESLGWAKDRIRIPAFDGARKVQSLPVYPLSHHASHRSMEAALIKRGKRYLELLEPTYQEYSGFATTENIEMTVGGSYKRVNIHATGRIMLDPAICFQQNNGTELLNPKVLNQLTPSTIPESDLVYCNSSVGGFSFRQKKWCLFSIKRMSPVKWNTTAFTKLVMDEKKRDLIHTLVRSHKHDVDTFDGVVSGKGKGLVGLLSGNPGVGKTLTAEVIAEVTKRPLYTLSAGELGTDVNSVETALDVILAITRHWGCVLLVDEADVFLQERDGINLERNALVSILLRRLEYFQGVLIMTTNRKRTIDAAFDSRIHFKVHYPDLSAPSRATIWRNCLANAPTGLQVEIRDDDIESLSNLKLNGRQIKNAVACAVAIGVEEKKAVTLESIKLILEMVVNPEDDDRMVE